MKTVYITTMLVIAMLMLILPLTAGQNAAEPQAQLPVSGNNITEQETEIVKVLHAATEKIETYTLEEYLFGVVAAEMPALYEKEALKAQAVAAHTFYLSRKESNAEKDYDITDDYNLDQAFITPEKAKEKWGSGAAEYTEKIKTAVKEVAGLKITYEGRPIMSVYHAISFGKTENAAEVWGGEYPYLTTVDSSFDKQAEGYVSEKTFTAAELKAALSGLAELKSTTENCISDIKKTSAGGVKSLTVSGTNVTVSQFRKATGLRSADFDVTFKEGAYTFTTRGYGHSIGMSQHGANCLAKEGKNFEEILLYYYTGCKIE